MPAERRKSAPRAESAEPVSSVEIVPATASRTFAELGLAPQVLEAVHALGYEIPTPIQERTIPLLLSGRDVLGQAQTGTGKTAAFALPALCGIDVSLAKPQVLVLAPTRELAIQVAEAFSSYSAKIPGFRVLAVYGGSPYPPQLKALARGPHVIVGTPGRLMDHIERGALSLSSIRTFVLDEADEMLRMGFIDDVTFILEKAPAERQLVMFSATVPAPIRAIARKHQRDAVEVRIESKQATAKGIRQRYLPLNRNEKLTALLLLLEMEAVDGVLVFTRTKVNAAEVTEHLVAEGIRAAVLSGDIGQAQRERTVEMLKNGQIDVLVATDVAARGLDVERISHVVNYDVPMDSESYIHRIGRTGRAGREGEAILFVEARERGLLAAIERATNAKLEVMRPPSVDEINTRRVARFKERVHKAIEKSATSEFRPLIEALCSEEGVAPLDIAIALAQMIQGNAPLLITHAPIADRTSSASSGPARSTTTRDPRVQTTRSRMPEPERDDRDDRGPEGRFEQRRPGSPPKAGMRRYRIEVGSRDRVHPGQIVGAIANEAGIEGRFIGPIDIHDEFTFVDLPQGLPVSVVRVLERARVAGKPMRLAKVDAN